MKDGNEQEIPLHYHIHKTEDIINRTGGILCVEVMAKGADGSPNKNLPVTLWFDGEKKTLAGGSVAKIPPGNSITLTPLCFPPFLCKNRNGRSCDR